MIVRWGSSGRLPLVGPFFGGLCSQLTFPGLLWTLGFRSPEVSLSCFPRDILFLGVVVDLLDWTFSLPHEEVGISPLFGCSASLPFLRLSELVPLVGFLSFAADFSLWEVFAA